MTDADETEEAKLLGQVPPRRSGLRGFLSFVFVVMLIAMAGLAAALFWQPLRDMVMPASGAAAPSSAKLGDLDRKFQVLSARVDELSTRVDTLAATPAAAPAGNAAAAAPPSGDAARMQNELSALSATLSGLQADVKQAGSVVTDMHTQAQMSVAQAVAFIQLRDAAMTGHGFGNELAAMQTTTKADPAFEPSLTKLKTYADNGAPNIPSLHDQLMGLTGSVDRAIASANAQNWWERVLAELKGLISVRPLHSAGTPEGTMEVMEDDLARDDVTAALNGVNNLPAEAQTVLAAWRKQTEARQDIDTALHNIADLLIAGPQAAPNAPARNTP